MGISEHTAVLVEAATGLATIVGDGPVYFLKSEGRYPAVCTEGKPLSWDAPGIKVQRWNSTDTASSASIFDFGQWNCRTCKSVAKYSLSAYKGELTSTQHGGGIY